MDSTFAKFYSCSIMYSQQFFRSVPAAQLQLVPSMEFATTVLDSVAAMEFAATVLDSVAAMEFAATVFKPKDLSRKNLEPMRPAPLPPVDDTPPIPPPRRNRDLRRAAGTERFAVATQPVLPSAFASSASATAVSHRTSVVSTRGAAVSSMASAKTTLPSRPPRPSVVSTLPPRPPRPSVVSTPATAVSSRHGHGQLALSRLEQRKLLSLQLSKTTKELEFSNFCVELFGDIIAKLESEIDVLLEARKPDSERMVNLLIERLAGKRKILEIHLRKVTYLRALFAKKTKRFQQLQ